MHDIGCNQGRLNPDSAEITRRTLIAFWREYSLEIGVFLGLALWTAFSAWLTS